MISLKKIEDRYLFNNGSELKTEPCLIRATGNDDGELYLLRLYPKTHTAIDQDLRSLLSEGMRRMRRVLAVDKTREVFVEAVELVEDENHIAIVMLETGHAFSEISSQRRQAFRDAARTGVGRAKLWRGLAGIAVALDACHRAGIVHGAVGNGAVFVDDRSQMLRLGGYETAIKLSATTEALSRSIYQGNGAVSFHRDWADFSEFITVLFGLEESCPPPVLVAEKKLIERLAKPPRFHPLEGSELVAEICGIATELERIGSSSQGELVCYPDRRVLNTQIAEVVQGAISPDDTNLLLAFISEDLSDPSTRIASWTPNGCDLLLITSKATYGLKIIGEFIARIVRMKNRQASDNIDGSSELLQQVTVCLNRKEAEERKRKAGAGAKAWEAVSSHLEKETTSLDLPIWHALILIEVFLLLSQDFQVYPIDVVPLDDEATVAVVPRVDQVLESKRKALGLKTSFAALQRDLSFDDGSFPWTLSEIDTVPANSSGLPLLSYKGMVRIGGKSVQLFETDSQISQFTPRFLMPKPSRGVERAVVRRLRSIVASRGQDELLYQLDDPRRTGIDPMRRDVAAPGSAPDEMDKSKADTWNAIQIGRALDLIVGPPGVGKTYFVTRLIESIIQISPEVRILVSAQNHESLALMERELKQLLSKHKAIVIRTPASDVPAQETDFRKESERFLFDLVKRRGDELIASQQIQIKQTLLGRSDSEKHEADIMLRDTDHLVHRSADVTLASANSFRVEELISEGSQFDWVIIEEAARANGPELLGPLLLGNRRIIIGDHNQLSPFGAEQRARLYEPAAAEVLLSDAIDRVSAISDVPPEAVESLEALKADPVLLRDALGIAARLEEPFRSIAERSKEPSGGGPVHVLKEQSRMHPIICKLVSDVFYQGALISSDRVKKRSNVVESKRSELSAPIVIADMPALSTISKDAFEQPEGASYINVFEARAVQTVIEQLSPRCKDAEGKYNPTLAILSPYGAQVNLIARQIQKKIDVKHGTLNGFSSAKEDSTFVHTVDGFQGGEADVVIVSLVRNNGNVGCRAVGFLRNKQRMNVLLSRARHKLILITSQQFLREAVDGVDPDEIGIGTLSFLREMLDTIEILSRNVLDDGSASVGFIKLDEYGRWQ